MNIVILTPIIVEHRAITAHLPAAKEVLTGGSRYLKYVFQAKDQPINIYTGLTGSKNEVTALAVKNAIEQFRPAVIILAGVAGGVKDVAIGDVVVGTKYYGYEFGKETPGGFVARPEGGYYSKELLTLAQSVADDSSWLQRRKIHSPNPVNIIFGPIASGNKVIAATDSAAYRLLKQSYNDTVAIEMEAIGFGLAMHSFPDVRFLNIRGISDLLDGKSTADAGGSQELAAANMAAFVFELVYRLDTSKFNYIGMDIKMLAEEVIKMIIPAIKTGTAEGPKGELLSKVMPELTPELEALKNHPDDKDLQADARSELRRALKEKPGLKEALESILEKTRKNEQGSTVVISNSKNIIQGSQISVNGDFHLGDK